MIKLVNITLLLFFINCNSLQNITDKRYIKLETTFKKYREIRAKYDSLVARNEQSLVYENGAYFKKSLYDKETKEKRYQPEKSDSKLILKDGDKAYFLKDDGQSVYIYTLENGKIIEQSRIIKKDDKVDMVINSVEGVGVRYDYFNNKIYITQFVQDEFDADKQDLMLHQEFVDDKLVDEKNYKKDFRITKEQMLNKLAGNFYSNATIFIQQKEKEWGNDEFQEVKSLIDILKKDIEEAVSTKNSFYKKIKIIKNYDKDVQPIYDISIPIRASNPNPSGYWEMRINGKTNQVIDFKLSMLQE